MRATIQVLFLLSILSIGSYAFQFKFNEDGNFTILQITDLHYGENDTFDIHTSNLTKTMIELVKPDLIVVSGDGVSGWAGASKGAGWYKQQWENFTRPIEESGTPYAYLLGNHDDEADLKRPQIVALDSTNPHSIRNSSEGMDGKAVFYVPIWSSIDEHKLAANIWMFDSGGYGCEGHNYSYGCIEQDQLEWYDNTSQKIKDEYGTNIHHLSFYHIAIPEYLEVYNNLPVYGVPGENLGCSYVNSGFFHHVLKNQDISFMSIGHDHYNDFGAWYKGVEFVYGRKTGYGGYGDIRGARVIKLKEDLNEQGELNVTRNHYVIYENGTLEYTYPLIPRNGTKQDFCKPIGPVPNATATTFLEI